jgi:hypothetical protein
MQLKRIRKTAVCLITLGGCGMKEKINSFVYHIIPFEMLAEQQKYTTIFYILFSM